MPRDDENLGDAVAEQGRAVNHGLPDSLADQRHRRRHGQLLCKCAVGHVNGVVNGSGHAVARISGVIRRVQSGLIQHYASIILLGVIFILIYLYID